MKRQLFLLLSLGFLPALFSLLLESNHSTVSLHIKEKPPNADPELTLEEAAFQILDSKCNVCHRKKNPFKVFKPKNMEKHAPKIYKQVFVYRRMPKGNDIQLTEEEYQTLRNWLNTQNLK